jgi:dienelactone hydrolase
MRTVTLRAPRVSVGPAAALLVALLVADTLIRCSSPVRSPASLATGPATVIPLPTNLPAAIPYEDAMRLFEYDRSVPFDVREEGVTDYNGAAVHAITYTRASGERAAANLVLPEGAGPFGALIYLPGGGGGDREYLYEAADLSRRGIVSLLIDHPELLDLLGSLPEVDPHRLGLVGGSYGAVRGVTFAGIEGSRLKIAVLMSTPPSYDVAAMAPFDPIVWAPHVSPCALYIQEGTQDVWFTHEEAESLIAAAKEPKRLVWYEANHGLNEQASADRFGWLVEALGSPGAADRPSTSP